MHDILGVNSSSVTKAGRKIAATAPNDGASAESIDKQGHWATRTRDGSYANHTIPFDAVRVLAGFGPEPGRYYLQRGIVEPAPKLQRMVFSKIESSVELLQKNGREIAGTSFLQLMEYLRVVLLQDAAISISLGLHHKVYQHPIFSTVEFLAFQTDLLNSIKVTPEPESVMLSRAYPIVAEHLKEIRTDTANLNREFSLIKRENRESQQETLRQIGTALVKIGSSLGQDVQSSNSLPGDIMPFASHADTLPLHNSLTPAPSLVLPPFQMSRKLYTVHQAWSEYEYGLDGRTSIKSLELKFGTTWRQDKSEAKYFQRRVPLYRAIELLVSQSSFSSHELAVGFLENLKRSRSLRSICDDLKNILQTYSIGIGVTFVQHLRSTWKTSNTT